MSLKSNTFNGNGARAKGGSAKLGGGSPNSGVSGNGTEGEWGLSAGNEKAPRRNPKLDVTQQPDSHKLQHVDYSELTDM